MPTGLGGERGWWCPTLDDTGNGTLWIYDQAASNNLFIERDIDEEEAPDTANKWVADTSSGGVRAVEFDGINDFAEGTLSSNMIGASQASISYWFKRDATSSYAGFFGIGVNASASDRLVIQPWNDGNVYVTFASAIFASIASNDTSWHHVVVLFDGSQSGNSNRLKIYLDDTLQSPSYTGTIPTTTGSPNIVRAGSSISTSMLPGSGRIDDCRLYSRVLTGAEVTHLFSERGVTGAAVDSFVADAGSFTVAGQAAEILASLEFASAGGSFVVAAQAAGFVANAAIMAESGAFLLTGGTYGESYARAIVAATGTFTVSSESATIRVPNVADVSAVGSFAVTGGAAVFVDGDPFLCETGLFSLVGEQAHQSISQPAAVGSFSLAGISASFVVQPFFDAQSGGFSFVGSPASFVANQAGAARHVYYHFLVRG